MKKNIFIAIATLFIGLSTVAQVDRTNAPKPQPNPEIKISIPDVITTDNGMKVIVVENHKLPRVSFQLYINYPTMKEGDKSGISGIFGELLGSGTKNNSKDEFDAKIDYMGANLSTNPRGLYGSSLKKHTPKLLELISEVLISPAFPEDEFDRILNQSISALAAEKSDPGAMSSHVSNIVNYGKDHPYGEITTEETLGNIKLDDVKNYYNDYFRPNNAYLIVVGDVTQEEAKQYVDKYFSVWEKGKVTKEELFTCPKSSGTNVYFVNKPGAVQSNISINHTIDLKPGHEDNIKLRVLNHILGGGSFSARLMSNLREDKAYTYGCYSSFSSDKIKGEFSAGGSFRNEVTDSAVVQIMYEINRISADLVTDRELELAINSITGSFARSLESPQTIARFALNTIMYDLPKDYYANYLTVLGKVTKEDLLEVAKKYLRPTNMNIVIVGNENIAEKLAVFDTNGGMEFKDAYGNDQLMLKSAPDGVTAQSIIDGYIFKSFSSSSKEEMDGKLAKIGFIQTTYKSFIEEYGATMYMIGYKGSPNKTASIVKINSGQGNMVAQKEWFNGETGGTFAMGVGKSVYEGSELEDKKNGAFPLSQSNYFKGDKYEIELMGIDEVDGKEYYKIRLEMEETFMSDEEGNSQTTIMKFSDYKDAGKGVFLPHKMSMNAGGQKMEFDIENVTIKKKPNSPVFEGEF
jgi:predicted Zn-dependent peptidase